MTLPLPKRAAELIGRVKCGFHPGLALDKHVDPPADAENQKPILRRVCAAGSEQKLLDSLNERRRSTLQSAISWTGKSSGPLTLHLSRATALENAGIALHPIYGFAYLPGSGLKGLARAWAERVWLETQADRIQAVGRIRAIFGYAPNSERCKSWVPAEIVRDPHSSAGAAVFYDAWPTNWPKLIVDVVAVHHPKYYQEPDELRVPPPGDWEDPVPTTFLAVGPGAEFEFAVAPRRPGRAELARQAAEWLKAALADWGAGAKTAAGYGRIISENLSQRVVSPLRRRFECTLELVTPAFLAGAFQKEEDCDLRGATLRGLLRWWWRTMHAGHLEPPMLRRLETAIWGAAGEGGAVQLALEALANGAPQPFRERPVSPLGYLAYGMQAQPPDRPTPRNSCPPGSRWRLTLSARAAAFRSDPHPKEPAKYIQVDLVLDQVRAALWLLTHYGGVGAKGRKGFGSLADVRVDGVTTIEDCKQLAKAVRDKVGLGRGRPDFRAPCLERVSFAEFALRPGQSLTNIAAAYREFVKSKSLRDRRPLGLPRKQDRADMALPDVPVHRHATTVHFHMAKSANGLVLRIAGFAIERIVPGAVFFDEMEQFLRSQLGGGPPSQTRGSAALQRRRDGRPAERPGTPEFAATPRAAQQYVPGGYAILEGMRVTIVELRGNRARIRFPESGEEHEVNLAELDPYIRS